MVVKSPLSPIYPVLRQFIINLHRLSRPNLRHPPMISPFSKFTPTHSRYSPSVPSAPQSPTSTLCPIHARSSSSTEGRPLSQFALDFYACAGINSATDGFQPVSESSTNAATSITSPGSTSNVNAATSSAQRPPVPPRPPSSYSTYNHAPPVVRILGMARRSFLPSSSIQLANHQVLQDAYPCL